MKPQTNPRENEWPASPGRTGQWGMVNHSDGISADYPIGAVRPADRPDAEEAHKAIKKAQKNSGLSETEAIRTALSV